MSLCLFNELPPVGICGLGHALPATLRGNDDEQYSALRKDSPFYGLFTGYGTRRVLGDDESLAELMAEACRNALDDGALTGASVDLLTGFASVSEFVAPNELYQVHRILGLSPGSDTLPIADEFAAFLSGLRLAAERIWLERSEAALVVCGCRWSGNIDYGDPVSLSIGDGAGAAVVRRLDSDQGNRGGFRLVGWNSEVPGGMYGVMRVCPRRGTSPTTLRDRGATTPPLFTMMEESEPVFRDWGVSVPPRIARDLVRAAGVDPQNVTCIVHQASSYLVEAWRTALAPMIVEDTIQSLGNMTLASIPITLCVKAESVRTRFVLLLGLGLGVHASACLLESL